MFRGQRSLICAHIDSAPTFEGLFGAGSEVLVGMQSCQSQVLVLSCAPNQSGATNSLSACCYRSGGGGSKRISIPTAKLTPDEHSRAHLAISLFDLPVRAGLFQLEDFVVSRHPTRLDPLDDRELCRRVLASRRRSCSGCARCLCARARRCRGAGRS